MALVYLHCFATITTIHLHISRIFSSFPTETLYPLNTNFPSSSQSLWQPPFYSLSLSLSMNLTIISVESFKFCHFVSGYIV